MLPSLPFTTPSAQPPPTPLHLKGWRAGQQTAPKGAEEPSLSLPPELIALAGVGWLASQNPAMAALATEQIDTNFAWNFAFLDLISMGATRVARSLERGSDPYNPKEDPETLKRCPGPDRWLYIQQQKLKRANWANFREEAWREVEAAPGSTAGPLLLFAMAPVLYGLFGQPTGGRALQVAFARTQEHVETLKTFTQQATPAQLQHPKALLNGYYQHLFANHPHASEPVEHLTLKLQQRPSQSWYWLGNANIKHLNTLQARGELKELDINAPLPLGKTGSLTLPAPTLQQLGKAWAHTMANLAAMEMDPKQGLLQRWFDPSTRTAYNQQRSKLALCNLLIETATLRLNAKHAPAQYKSKEHLPLQGLGSHNALPTLLELDKVRDLHTTALKPWFAHNTEPLKPQALAQRLQHTTHSASATKLVLSLASLGWAMWWMHYLTFKIVKKGSLYPANRLVRETGTVQPPPQPTATGGNPTV